ncbi:CBL-interacting serine/threonine-protein kinase 26-like [Ixodes scapularis]|uniref:CBL-interacting serine/threonine-protein kinase 26-like n=1 Tax=Ixodes scapularis TaxID=6945 RepID=UPI001A9DA023|nr:CBL-interacting serine/threonine-protein kinase 26-like [Ixodes scapularis]
MTTDEVMFYKYHIVESKGSGSFGKVFSALNKNTGKRVVIKNVPICYDKEWGYDFLFTNKMCEIDVIEHLCARGVDNVPRLLDYGYFRWNKEEIGYIVMEDTGSRDLFQCIHGPNKMSFDEADIMRIFTRILRCVYTAAASAGVYHGDLKTGNVIVDATLQNVQVIDWGSVHLVGNKKPRHRTCTTEYSSPESLVAESSMEGYDPELLLVWSLGAVLYKLAVGVMLHEKKDFIDYCKIGLYYACTTNVSSSSSSRVPSFQRKLNAKLDATVKSVKINRMLRRMLNANPNQRCRLEEMFEFIE